MKSSHYDRATNTVSEVSTDFERGQEVRPVSGPYRDETFTVRDVYYSNVNGWQVVIGRLDSKNDFCRCDADELIRV